MSRSPAPLTASTVLVAVEALGLLAAAVATVVELVVATSDDPTRAGITAGLAAVAAAGLGLVARGLARRRRWARSPAVVANLVVLPVAVDLLRAGRWPVGLTVLVLAVAVLVLLFLPSTSAALEE